MKKTYLSALVLILISGFLLVIFSIRGKISAQEQTDYSLSARCEVAQQKLAGPVRSRDLRTRVDRMQAYLYLYERLDIFTQRLENNDQPSAEQMRALTSELNVLINTFKNDYEVYDQARTAVATLKNCSQETEDFSASLEFARTTRSKVNEDVVAIHSLLRGPITTTMNELLTTLKSEEVAQGGSSE